VSMQPPFLNSPGFLALVFRFASIRVNSRPTGFPMTAITAMSTILLLQLFLLRFLLSSVFQRFWFS
jgi:hypothetical protein